MPSRAAQLVATVAFVALLLAGLLALAEGVAWLAGVKPLSQDRDFAARARSRRCQFGWDHPCRRCDPARVRGQRPFRIIAVGGSNLQGDPKTRHFPERLRDLLERARPGRYEVVNMGRVCKDSIYVRRCVERAISAEPDVIVVYTGHNDYANWGIVDPERMIFLEEHARFYALEGVLSHSRLYSVLARALADTSPREGSLSDEQLAHSFRTILDQFTANMERVIELARRHGTRVILVTVVSNLEYPFPRSRWDSPPLTHLAPYQERWQRAYREGVALFRSGQHAEALKAFERARDENPLGRARGELNERIRELGRRHADVQVVDLERQLERVGVHEGIGCNFFGRPGHCDQFHMNDRVQSMLAKDLARRIRALDAEAP